MLRVVTTTVRGEINRVFFMFLAIGAAAREPNSVSYLDCGQKSNNVHSEEARIADRI